MKDNINGCIYVLKGCDSGLGKNVKPIRSIITDGEEFDVYELHFYGLEIWKTFPKGKVRGDICDATYQAGLSDYQAEITSERDYISPSVWPDLMRWIRTLPEMEEAEVPDPEPLF